MGDVESALAGHAFEHLFIECLGWDYVRANVSLTHQDVHVTLEAVAQKRGFTVFLCPTHRTVLANRPVLRELQRKLRKSYHEHILIHSCETPRKQVWQWATTLAGDRRIVHREHPFFSHEPPPRLLERIAGLSVTLAEEEQTTLPDVLVRVRQALLPDSELNLFAKHPWYATQSDSLAMSVKRGEPGALGRFVEFHMPLARRASRMLVRWFEMDPEDAEQTAMIGLIEAARRFDPERGFQFSTYASYWIRQCCQRYGLEWSLPIRMPPNVFWRCYKLAFKQVRLIASHGEHEGRERFASEIAKAGVSSAHWLAFCHTSGFQPFSDVDKSQRLQLTLVDDVERSLDQTCAKELEEEIQNGLLSLSARQRLILRLRYGFQVNGLELQELAEVLGLRCDRVRRIYAQAEDTLELLLQKINSKSNDHSPLAANDDQISRAVHSLHPQQKVILKLRYGFSPREHTLQEVAEALGLTRERVRQIQAKAEEKLEQLLLRYGFREEATSVSNDLKPDSTE